MPELRIGIVGGAASTDAVAVDIHDRVLATAMVGSRDGIAGAIRAILVRDGVDARAVRWVMLGTDHVLEDVSATQDLRKVAVVRIGGPLTLAVPPLAPWPAPLREAVSAGEIVVAGGSEYDGRAMAALDKDALARFLQSLADRVQAVAITGMFAPVSPDHELAAADVARRELGNMVHISLSHEIGSIGLLERENATVLNAALGGAAERMAAAARASLAEAGIEAELLFTQNDGTLMVVDHALRFPTLMIASGPGTTIRGAADLSGVGDAVVVAVGAAAAYVGALVNGIGRERTGPTDIAGVRTSLRLPDVRRVAIGAPALADAVARATAVQPAVPVVVVGHGHRLVPDRLPGVSEVIRPPDGEFAQAIGAAFAPVSGQFARICLNRPDIRRAVLHEVRAEALARAVDAGAHPDTVAVVEVDETPLTYLVQPTVRIRVRAAGPF
jgi:N-methylhydantoinase A/oxoprolinase/acetone carboxylase beta subunit